MDFVEGFFFMIPKFARMGSLFSSEPLSATTGTIKNNLGTENLFGSEIVADNFGCRHSNFLSSCPHITEKCDGNWYPVTISIYQYDIAFNKKHKGLFIQPGTNLNLQNSSYFLELKITTDANLGRPILRCWDCTGSHTNSGYGPYHVTVNESYLHNFAEHYHHDTKGYDVFFHNCQAFVWFILYSHDIPESQLNGIIEFHNGHIPLDIRLLAEKCRQEYVNAKPKAS